MHPNTRRATLAVVAALALSGVSAGAAAADDSGTGNGRNRNGNDCSTSRGRFGTLHVVGLTADNRLICFNEYRPGKALTIGAITGLAGDTALVGIDYRPANGELIGLGNAGGVYSINPTNAGRDQEGPTRRGPRRAPRSASTSTRPSTVCESSATPDRTSAPTSTPVPRSSTVR